jgi:hypothetical protein
VLSPDIAEVSARLSDITSFSCAAAPYIVWL